MTTHGAGRPRPLLLRGWSRLATSGLVLTLLIILIALFGPWLMAHDPQAYSFYLNEGPSDAHWLGTDATGQDIYSRLILGTRLSLGVGAAAALVARRGLVLVFISHDLAVIRFVADRVLVMQDGIIVETGPARDVVEAPQNAYTSNLAKAARAIELP